MNREELVTIPSDLRIGDPQITARDVKLKGKKGPYFFKMYIIKAQEGTDSKSRDHSCDEIRFIILVLFLHSLLSDCFGHGGGQALLDSFIEISANSLSEKEKY